MGDSESVRDQAADLEEFFFFCRMHMFGGVEANEFKVGGRYRNAKDNYEVLSMDGAEMCVRYDGGAEQNLDCATQAKIVSRLEREEMSAVPPNTRAGTEGDVAWTLGTLAKHANFEAHVPPQSAKGFSSTYRRRWPDAPADLPACYPIANAASKWSVQLRICFPEKFESDRRFSLPNDVKSVAAPEPHIRRINNNAFWWHLVEQLGFQLGNAQDINKISKQLPEHLRAAFLDGAR